MQHIKQTHPELWCGACGAGFASPGQLLEHYLEAESAVHPTCNTCGEGFESQAVLDEVSVILHIRRRHINSHAAHGLEASSSADTTSANSNCNSVL